jgi:hypothetical protein
MPKDRKKKRQCKRMQGFKGEVYDSNAKERANHTHESCVLYRQKVKEKRKRSMLNKTTSNDGNDHQHQHSIVMGDILLHSESKIIVVQVVIQSLSTTSSSTLNKPTIHRLSPNSSGTNTLQTIVPCDLKNNPPIKINHERTKTSSSKKIIRMHKAGLALVKELKSKVITPNQTEQKTITVDNERTHL